MVPVDLRLPGQNEPEKYAAFMLGLSLPFPRCPGAQHCGEAWQCFHCHEIEKLEGKGFLRASFSKTWKHWKACMQVRNVNAQERLLAGLSLPFLRDLVGLREWCDVSCLDEMLLDGADPEISEEMPAQEPAGEDPEDQGILFPSASTFASVEYLSFDVVSREGFQGQAWSLRGPTSDTRKDLLVFGNPLWFSLHTVDSAGAHVSCAAAVVGEVPPAPRSTTAQQQPEESRALCLHDQGRGGRRRGGVLDTAHAFLGGAKSW